MKTKYRHTVMSPAETIIKKFGWEYHLVEGSDRKGTVHPQPCMFGMPNMALKSCKKIKGKK